MTKSIKSTSTTPLRLYEQFESAMDNLGGRTFLVAEDEVSSKLQSLLSDTIRKIVIYQTPLIDRLIPKTFPGETNNLSVERLPTIRPPDFDEESYRHDLIMADAGLIAADYIIADSGTVVLFGENHRAQLVTLLPPTLFVLATARQLIPDLFTFHDLIKKSNGHHFQNMHYISGPSRTSDIEKTLILGVHGPVELYVLVVKE